MKTVYLHFGRGKTGTTAIQAFLSRHRDALLEQGVHYLHAGDEGRGSGHQALAKSFIAQRPAYMIPPANPEAIRDRTARELASVEAPAILISSENFPLSDPAAVRGFITDALPDSLVRVLYFVRSQDELAESEYNQMVKLKRVTSTFEDYAEHALEGVDYLAETERWEKVFGRENILCRVFDAKRDSVISDFLSMLSLNAPERLPGRETGSQEQTNVSVGYTALAAMRLLNAIELSDREAVYAQIRSGFAGNDHPALMFDSRWGRRFRDRFADSNARFAERYLDGPRPDLGGRRYSDSERDRIRGEIAARALLP